MNFQKSVRSDSTLIFVKPSESIKEMPVQTELAVGLEQQFKKLTVLILV